MAEYVARSAACDFKTLYDWYISSVDDNPPVWTDEHIEELLNDFLVIPKDTPSANVAERKTATWLFPHLEPDDVTGHVYAECSNCHKVRIVDDFCPACGSRMVE